MIVVKGGKWWESWAHSFKFWDKKNLILKKYRKEVCTFSFLVNIVVVLIIIFPITVNIIINIPITVNIIIIIPITVNIIIVIIIIVNIIIVVIINLVVMSLLSLFVESETLIFIFILFFIFNSSDIDLSENWDRTPFSFPRNIILIHWKQNYN